MLNEPWCAKTKLTIRIRKALADYAVWAFESVNTIRIRTEITPMSEMKLTCPRNKPIRSQMVV